MEVNENVGVVSKKGFNPIITLLLTIIIYFVTLFIPIIGLLGSIIIGYIAIRNIGKHKIFSIITLILVLFVLLTSIVWLTMPDDVEINNVIENSDITAKNNDVENIGILTEDTGSWPDLISVDKDSNLAKMTRKFFTIVYGENGTLNSTYIKNVEDYNQEGMDYTVIRLQDKTYIAVSKSSDNPDEIMCTVLNSELTNGNVSTAFPPGENGNKLEKPSEHVVSITQKIVDSYKELLPNHEFGNLDKEDFSLSDKMYGLQFYHYVVRPDGYSQITVSEFDKNGSNAMTIYLIFYKEQVIGAGISPKYTITQGL